MHVVFNGNQYFMSGNHFIILGRHKKGDFEKHCACSTEMVGKEEQSCSSSFKNTKYDCL